MTDVNLDPREGLDPLYPIHVMQDRYSGAYSGGKWVAIAGCVPERLEEFGGDDDDVSAMEFWHRPPDWVAAGHTPDEAVKALRAKVIAQRGRSAST